MNKKWIALVLCVCMLMMQSVGALAGLKTPGTSISNQEETKNVVIGLGQKGAETESEPEEAAAPSNTVGGIGKKSNNTVSGLGEKKDEPAAQSGIDTSSSIVTGEEQTEAPVELSEGQWMLKAPGMERLGYTREEWYATSEMREKCVLLCLAECQAIVTDEIKQIVASALVDDNISLCVMTSDPDYVYMILVTTHGTLSFVYMGDGNAVCLVDARQYTAEQVAAYNMQALVDAGRITEFHKVDAQNVAALMAEYTDLANQ